MLYENSTETLHEQFIGTALHKERKKSWEQKIPTLLLMEFNISRHALQVQGRPHFTVREAPTPIKMHSRR